MRSWSFFQFSNCNVTKRSFVSRPLSRIGKNLNTDQLECFVELLQIIDEQVRPWAVHCLLLADDSFFKVEPPLPPPENLRHGCLPFDGAENRVPNRALLEINLAVSAPRLECEAPTPLAQTAHL